MRTLLQPSDHEAIIERLNSLEGSEIRQWGTMTVSQMLKHCRRQLEMGLKVIPTKDKFPTIVQWLAKQTFGYRIKWSQNLPTAPEMVVKEDADFEAERQKLLVTIDTFLKHEDFGSHPIFGKLTKEDWGKIAFKHLDHHLRQFER